MSDSEDENVLYASTDREYHHQGKRLIGGGSKILDEVLNGPKDGRRLKKTIVLCGAFIGLGLAVAVIGPTLQDLKTHLETDLPHISYIFTGRSIGYVIGSIVGGVFLEHLHPLLLESVTLGMSGIGLSIMPHILRLGPSIFTISLVGLANGALDTGANVIVLRMWGKKSAPFMQALHFSFALGAFIAPLLASPFIESNSPSFNSSSFDSFDSSAFDSSAFNSSATPTSKPALPTRFQGVYSIIGIYLMLMALVFIYFFCTSPVQLPSSSGTHSDLETESSALPSDKDFTNYILGLLFVFYFLYVGAEVGYGGYIYTFAISINLQHKTAAHLNSLFWGTFAIMRGVSIFIASMISPLQMLVMDLLGCILSSLVLSYEADTNPTVLWVGTATLGASMASLFPAGISWLESHAPVTGKMASLLLVGSAFGEMVIPIILGQLFEPDSVGPMSLMYLMCGISLVTALIFGYAVYLAASEGKEVEGPMPEEENPVLQILQGVQEEINLPTISLESKPGQVSKPVLIQKTHKE
ncbi:sodium-dependent glucose transporter 1A-like [Amphiura filiformis]|uniref:sodium-dependent glucose transporter 1A-like n=1 Tax=Amphiura filiformis TaxID=82378 RepID=UPI003B216717